MKVVLIPCGATEWDDAGRLLGRVELPLSPAGQSQCGQWVQSLHGLELQRIFHAPDELATQTAGYLGRQLSVPVKPLEGLSEVDIGLWAGLTESELKTRYATAHRELCEAPLNVNPPGGESLKAAASRLEGCIRKQIKKKNGDGAIGVVVRPFSFAMARCALEGRGLTDMLTTVKEANAPVVVDCQQAPAPAQP